MRRMLDAILIAVSLVALVSFGGQLVAVWVLLPSLWWRVGRSTHRAGVLVWSTLAALLVAETLPMLAFLAGGRGWFVGLTAAAGLLATCAAFARRASATAFAGLR